MHTLFFETVDISLKQTSANNGKFKNFYRYNLITKPMKQGLFDLFVKFHLVKKKFLSSN